MHDDCVVADSPGNDYGAAVPKTPDSSVTQVAGRHGGSDVAVSRPPRCPICGGLNPGDITHSKCDPWEYV